MENTLHRFVQPRLHPLNLTELKADCRHHCTVFTWAKVLLVSGSASADIFEPRARFGGAPLGFGKLVGATSQSEPSRLQPGGFISSLESSGGMRKSFAEQFAAECSELAESSPDLAIWRSFRSFRKEFLSVT